MLTIVVRAAVMKTHVKILAQQDGKSICFLQLISGHFPNPKNFTKTNRLKNSSNDTPNPYCQLTRLQVNEADEYWSVGCGSNHYKIHDYVLDPKSAPVLPTSVLASTTAIATAAASTTGGPRGTSSSKPLPSTNDNLTAPHPAETLSSSSSYFGSSAGASASVSVNASAIPSTHSTTTTSARNAFYTMTYISADDEAKAEKARKKQNPMPAILGSAIGSLAIIYLLLFTWWYKGPRRRKHQREQEAKEAAERVLREQGLRRLQSEFKATGKIGRIGIEIRGPHGIIFQEKPQPKPKPKPQPQPQQMLYIPPHVQQPGQHEHEHEPIHELPFSGTMTNPKTPRLPEMPNDPPPPKELYDHYTIQQMAKIDAMQSRFSHLLHPHPDDMNSPSMGAISSRWDGTSQGTATARSASSAAGGVGGSSSSSSRQSRAGTRSSSGTSGGSSWKSKSTFGGNGSRSRDRDRGTMAESGIFGFAASGGGGNSEMRMPVMGNPTTTTNMVVVPHTTSSTVPIMEGGNDGVAAELDGRHMTLEERERERRERLEGVIDLATQPIRWDAQGRGSVTRASAGTGRATSCSTGGTGARTSTRASCATGGTGGRTSEDTSHTFGAGGGGGGGGGNNGGSGTMGRITMVPPTEWYMRQQAEDENTQEQRETIHVGWSPFGQGSRPQG